MKKIGGLLALGAIVGLPACADLDERLVANVGSEFFGTPEGLDNAVNAAYSNLRGFYGREESHAMLHKGTDEWMNADQPGFHWYSTYTPELGPIDNATIFAWNSIYRGINVANAAIERAAGIQGMPTAVRDRRVAEARFLRAFYYYNAVELWGPTHFTLTENRGVSTVAHRTPEDSIYSQGIIPDLEFAIANLPATPEHPGRVTRPAAQHLLAKVLLTRSYRPYAQPTDADSAAALARRVISTSGRSLLPNYADLWCPNANCPNTSNTRNNEVIFAIQFSRDANLNTNQGHGNLGNTWHLHWLSWYDDMPGLPRSILYGRAIRRTRPTDHLINLYDRERDTRYAGSFQSVWLATAAATGQGNRPIAVGDTAYWQPGFEVTPEFRASKAYRIVTPSQYDIFRYPSLLKHQDPMRADVQQWEGGKDLIWARLGETYLLAAEALLQAGRPGEAVEFVNAVRRRAARPGVNQDVGAAQITLDFILDERSRELAGEGHRWFDLRRVGPDIAIERIRRYNPQAAPRVQRHHILRPIPQPQIDRTSTPFPQNPGY